MSTDSRSATVSVIESGHIEHRADQELMQSVAAGDRDAQRRLAQRILPLCRRICRALVRDPIDADDATQISVLEILRSAKGFRGQTTIEGWAQRVVVRTTMHYLKRQRRCGNRMDAEARVSQVRAPSLKLRVAEELARPVEDYLDELPEPQREAILLRHALDYSVAEIADLVGVSPNTAKARLLHGRRTLRRLIRRDLNIGVLAKGGPS